MSDVKLPFGKYKGLHLTELVYVDRDYVEWLRCQSDLVKRYPSVAKGLADLGASGDETPTHNAIQAYFLDETPCRALIKRLWGGGLSAKLARGLVASKRRDAIFDVIGRASPFVTYSSTKRGEILKEMASVRKQVADLRAAQLLDDDKCLEACRTSLLRSGSWHLLSRPSVEARAHIRAITNELGSKLEGLREKLLEMRTRLVEARSKYDAIVVDAIQMGFNRAIRKFEETNGSDVHLRYVLEATMPDRNPRYPDVTQTFDIWIEIKPYLGDDYPSVLRQMTLQKKQSGSESTRESRFVLVVGKYGGQGVTLDQLRQIFSDASIDLVLLEEIGCQMPAVASQRTQALPLFQN